MAENKTVPTKASVTAFLNKINDKARRDDCFALVKMMREVSKEKPVLWGNVIVGFGQYRYKYASGREGDWMLIGFAPRKKEISLYLMGGVALAKSELPKLGKHKTGMGCLYINSLDDVNLTVLKRIIAKAYKVGKNKGHFGAV